MSIAEETTNKATLSRLIDAINTGDAEIISKSIDEAAEPDVLFHRQCPLMRRGRKRLSKCGRCSFGAFPTFTLRSRM